VEGNYVLKGFEDDVKHCSLVNKYKAVPILKDDCFLDFLSTKVVL
jgi:2-phosphosulfolactate phosphatase